MPDDSGLYQEILEEAGRWFLSILLSNSIGVNWQDVILSNSVTAHLEYSQRNK